MQAHHHAYAGFSSFDRGPDFVPIDLTNNIFMCYCCNSTYVIRHMILVVLEF